MQSRKMEKSSNVASSGDVMTALAEKLRAIGGDGKFAACEWRIRVALNWHTKPKSTIRHMINLERRPTYQEAQEIEAAYAKHCAAKVEQNRRENAELIESIIRFAEQARHVDEDFYQPRLEALRESLLRLGIDMPDLGRSA